MLLQKNISHELNYLDLDFNCCYAHTCNCY